MHNRGVAIARVFMAALILGVPWTGGARAQADAKESADSPPASVGFSIETEMFTYRALESNSEAIACDIAAYLNKDDAKFTKSTAGAVCNIKTGSRASVILLPFASSEFQDFQIWRADMATMARLHNKAQEDCPAVSASDKGGTLASKLTSVVSATPAGPPLAIAQGILALMATGISTASVGGTIHDQAFMDGVGRELQALSVPVLMPTAYTPFSLVALDENGSPFLASLNRILDDREACSLDSAPAEGSKVKGGKPKSADLRIDARQRRISEIDAFLNSLSGEALQAPKDGAAAATAKNSGTTPGAPGASGLASSHLGAVLLADGLAAKLGVAPQTGVLSADDRASTHVLLVEALESGGSVTRLSNVFGTKIRYSGGSVGTYALFTLDGDLECSGNVYEYGGSIQAKDVPTGLAAYVPDPANQMVTLRHSCKRLRQMR